MRAVIAPDPGGPEALQLTVLPDPEPGPGEVAIEVAATAVNRADVMQRKGFYPPPPGASEVLGLECSGRVAELGEGVTGWNVGDEVCALLAGGGYGTRVVVPAGQVMPVPDGVDVVTAAALPEVACTVWSNVYRTAALHESEVFLVHGGSGGIGTFAIQLVSARGSRVMTTAGTSAKLDACRELGAEVLINYRESDFVEEVRAATDGAGADVILDNMGAKYLDRNVDALAQDGRLVVIGLQGGTKAEINLGKLLGKRGSLHAKSLRSRPVEDKTAICTEVVTEVWPLVADGRVRPIVHTTMPLADAAAAHELMESSDHIGKILLTT